MSQAKVFILSEMSRMARSRSLLIFGALFSILLLAITSLQLFALPTTTSFTRFSASFLNVLLFLLPLFTLAIGALSIAADVESRWFSLLRTYPIKVNTYTSGKYIALFSSFGLMLIIGYGLVLILYAFQGTSRFDMLLFILSLLTVAIFSALAILVGSIAENRLHSLSISLGVWAFFLLIYDYLIMAIGTIVSGNLLQKLVIILTFTNPAEWLRVGFILYSGNASVLGPVYFNFAQFFLSPLGVGAYAIISGFWIIGPLLLSNKILKNKEGR